MDIVENENCGERKFGKWTLWKMEVVENGILENENCGKWKLWTLWKRELWSTEIVHNKNCGGKIVKIKLWNIKNGKERLLKIEIIENQNR